MTETDFYFILFMSNATYNGEGNNVWKFAVEWFNYLYPPPLKICSVDSV